MNQLLVKMDLKLSILNAFMETKKLNDTQTVKKNMT